MKEKIQEIMNESGELKIRAAETMSEKIEKAAKMIIESIQKGGKLIVFGNGGSAADAQHMQAELTHQFEIKNRPAIPCISLTTNTSVLTAIGNDWGYEKVFERQIEKMAEEKDVALGITTSGNSPNIILGIEQAKKQGAKTIALSGKNGGKIKETADLNLIVPHEVTARIQEVHITIIHILCKLIEEELYGNA